MRRIAFPILTIALLLSARPATAQAPVANLLRLGSLVNPIPDPRSGEPAGPCGDHVYIFAINGLDPLCLGNFNGACRYLRQRGYPNVRFGQLHSSFAFGHEIRAVHASDPEARIVLVGYSFGANYCRCLANSLARDGIRVDLLAYVAGDTIRDMPRSFPPNVCRVMNVTAHGCFLYGSDLTFKGCELTGARNSRLDVLHIQVWGQRETMAMLLDELEALTNPAGDLPTWEPGVIYNEVRN